MSLPCLTKGSGWPPCPPSHVHSIHSSALHPSVDSIPRYTAEGLEAGVRALKGKDRSAAQALQQALDKVQAGQLAAVTEEARAEGAGAAGAGAEGSAAADGAGGGGSGGSRKQGRGGAGKKAAGAKAAGGDPAAAAGPQGFQVLLALVTRRTVAYGGDSGNLSGIDDDEYEEEKFYASHWCTLGGLHLGLGRRTVDVGTHMLQVRREGDEGLAAWAHLFEMHSQRLGLASGPVDVGTHLLQVREKQA